MPGSVGLAVALEADRGPAPQTSIVTDGFRSLADGETVEFYVESGDDGRTKAVQVTGPGGAPPQGARPPCANCHFHPLALGLRRSASLQGLQERSYRGGGTEASGLPR